MGEYKKNFLPFSCLFLLLIGANYIYNFIFSSVCCIGGYCGGGYWTVLLLLIGIVLIYFSFKLWKEKFWKELMPSASVLCLLVSIYVLVVTGDGLWYILHQEEYLLEIEDLGMEVWFPTYYEIFQYAWILVFVIIGIATMILGLKLYSAKKKDIFYLGGISSLVSFILFLYGITVVFRSILLLDFHFNSPPDYYSSGILYMIFGLISGLSLILLLPAQKTKMSVKIPLIGAFAFCGLSTISNELSVIVSFIEEGFWIFELSEIISFLIPIFIGIISIILAFLILKLGLGGIKEILMERYKIA